MPNPDTSICSRAARYLSQPLLTIGACLLFALGGQWAQADNNVTIQLKWLHQFQFAGFYAALEKGYFADEGLEVTLLERDVRRNVLTQVTTGEVDYGVSDSILLLQHAQGEPLVLVAAIMQHSADVFITMADSGLTTPADLVGRSIGFYNTDADSLDLIALLTDQGIVKNTLIRRNADKLMEALISGEIDAASAYLTNEPHVMREMGHRVNLIYPRNYGFDLYGDMLFTSKAEAANNPQRVDAIRRAVLRGWNYALDNKPEMIELIHQKYNTQGKSRAALAQEAEGIDSLIARYTIELGELNPGRIDYIVRQLARLNMLQLNQNQTSLIFTPTSPNAPQLTREERAFLASLGKINVAVEAAGWPPFEFLDEHQHLRGIASDYLSYLQQTLNIDFKIHSKNSWHEILDGARSREIDLLPAATSTPGRREFLTFTDPYVRSPMVVITRDDVDFIPNLNHIKDKKIGVVGGYASDEMLSRYYSDLALIRYPGTLAGLQAVASGDIYAFIDNLAVSNHLIKQEGLANLKISGQIPYNFDLGIGVRSDWPLLHSAIDKTLSSMTPQQHSQIYDRWIHLTVAQGFPWQKIWPALMAISIIIILLLMYMLRMRKLELALREKNQLLQTLSVTDKLTGVFNRHRLDEVLEQEFEHARRYNRPLSLVLFDLDHFKQVNDQYGHQAGDIVLQRFAATANACIRQSDIMGRWGGEEFLLICPETTTAQAIKVAEKIRIQFSQQVFDYSATHTVSAGVMDNRHSKTVDQLITAADTQLYQAKQAGRNCVYSSGV